MDWDTPLRYKEWLNCSSKTRDAPYYGSMLFLEGIVYNTDHHRAPFSTSWLEDEEIYLKPEFEDEVDDLEDFRFYFVDELARLIVDDNYYVDSIQREGLLSCTLLWFDFYIKIIRRGIADRSLGWLDQYLAWILHTRRIREVARETIQKQLSLFQLSLMTFKDWSDLYEVPHISSSCCEMLDSLLEVEQFTDFWEKLGVNFEVETYGPGY